MRTRTRQSIWDEVAPLLSSVERPSRYTGGEWGAGAIPLEGFSFCMVYPDTYELGQANQAVRILTNRVNAEEGLVAERAYLPGADMADLLRSQGLPLFSLDNAVPLGQFDVVGITLPHELCATNVLETLDLAGIPVTAEARGEGDPIVIAGGPCAFNPEPYGRFFDAILIGEGEESVPETLHLIRRLQDEGVSREEVIRALAKVEGAYVPALYQERGGALVPGEGAPETVRKRVFEGFAEADPWEPMVVPFAECVHDRLNVEVLRGCTRGCRFCQAGMIYRPVRERPVEAIVDAVKRGIQETGYEEVSLTSLSTTDHSRIAEILEELNAAFADTGVRISVPSQRLDAFGVDMASAVAGQKRGGLTFAPEAATQRLRDVINKNVTDEDLMGAVDAAMAAGWQRLKLYFMIGLPTETDEDVVRIGTLANAVFERMRELTPKEARGRLKLSCAVNVFVPKAHTPFQWEGQITAEEARRRVGLIRQAVRSRAVRVDYHEPKTSLLEAVMSRGGREVGLVVEEAWKRGARFDAWTEHFSQEAWTQAARAVGIDLESAAHDPLPLDGPLPWSHIDSGVSAAYLKKERARAFEGETTEDCTFAKCTGCGVCSASGPTIHLEGRRGNQ